MRTLGLALLAASALACISAPPHAYTIERDHAGAPGVATILMLPLNVTAPLPHELEEAAPRVEGMIAEYLLRTGRKVESIEYVDARSAWAAAARGTLESTGEADFATALSELARNLHEIHDFDTLIIPNLLMREARIYGGSRYALWDGVKRPLRMADEATDHSGFNVMTTITGGIPGVSLHVTAHDPAGNKVFNSIAGLDLIHDFSFVSAGDGVRGIETATPLRAERLTDETLVREGIDIAFDPYLLPGEPAPGSGKSAGS